MQSFLYGERVNYVTFSEFVNKELILFSNADNERSIGSLVDGKTMTGTRYTAHLIHLMLLQV